MLPAFVMVFFIEPSTRNITVGVLSDAFLQVSAFVAATLALYYLIAHHIQKFIPAHLISKHKLIELTGAAFLGALPGCGGAIVVITQFTRGNLRFGSVVAVLTSTMGDAAFLLIAQRPVDGLIIMLLGFSVGVISGWVTNSLHTDDFLRPKKLTATITKKQKHKASPLQISACYTSYYFWKIALIPTFIIAVLFSFQLDPNVLLNMKTGSIEIIGAVAGFITLFLWSISSKGSSYKDVTSEEHYSVKSNWIMRAALDTQFVTSWVVVAFLTFELAIVWTGLDLASGFQNLGAFSVLLAIVIGLLPGCGPQILVTSLYLQNTIPFSAQIGNAISNDGDALFPAIALAPKAALVATVYSTIPALIAGYSYYFLFETG